MASSLAHRRAGRLSPARPDRAADDQRIDDLDALASWMDSAFPIPGTKFRIGFDALLGLLPGIGDALSGLIALYVLTRAHRDGVSRATLARMGVNVAVDAAIGAIPLAGDLFDVAFKANRRNVDLLRARLAAAPTARTSHRRADGVFLAAIIAALAVMAVAGGVATYYAVRALAGLFA
jgi:hypothetical protein